MCEVALNFLNNSMFNPSLNLTYLALIPKKSNAAMVSDFRPISLCNVLYKIIAKTIANRLKLVLDKIISPFQTAFMPGRLITDNILVAYEALYTMSTRMKGKKGYMAIKLDMSKAYDRVKWSFLEAMMLLLGSAKQWVQFIMRCVSSVSYAVLLNGSPPQSFLTIWGSKARGPLIHLPFSVVCGGLKFTVKQCLPRWANFRGPNFC
jgi:hypothetical protein